jgi:hypothetical protein
MGSQNYKVSTMYELEKAKSVGEEGGLATYVTKILPDFESEIAKRYRLVVLDEEYFPSSSLRGHQILRSKHMRICHILHVSYVPEIGAIPDNPRCLLLGETSVYWRNQLRIAFAE